MADNSKEQKWNKNESVPILHTTELEQEWNKNDFLEQKWNKNGPFLFNFRLQCLDDLLDWEVFLLSALVVFLLPLTTGVNSKSLLMSESSGEGRE